MGKGLATNVIDITLVLVPRTQRKDPWHRKNPRSGTIKGAKAPTKRHSKKEALDTLEKIQKRVVCLKHSKMSEISLGILWKY